MITPETFEYWYKAEVVGVWDGDSITVNLDLGYFTHLHDRKIRLRDINAPELRGEQRLAGLAARDALRNRILGKEVVINTYIDRIDKYGRMLGYVYLNGENINQWMLDNGYAVPYTE